MYRGESVNLYTVVTVNSNIDSVECEILDGPNGGWVVLCGEHKVAQLIIKKYPGVIGGSGKSSRRN
jgi:hypothetical protein